MRRRTVFLDLDGTLCESSPDWRELEILPGVREIFRKLDEEHACVVIVTARKESHRSVVERKLLAAGLFWDHLLMGVGNGERVLVNDRGAVAVTCEKNKPWRLPE